MRDFVRLYGLRYLLDLKLVQTLAGLIVLGLVGLACVLRPGAATLTLLGFVLGVPVLLFAIGTIAAPVWIERTLFWPLPLGFTLVAVAITQLRQPWARRAALALVLGFALINFGFYHLGHRKEPYREALATIEGSRHPGDALLLVPDTTVMSTTYYAERRGLVLDTYVVVPGSAKRSMGPPTTLQCYSRPTHLGRPSSASTSWSGLRASTAGSGYFIVAATRRIRTTSSKRR